LPRPPAQQIPDVGVIDEDDVGSRHAPRPPGPPGPPVVIASLLRPAGGSGVQTHSRAVQEHLRSVSRPCEFINPFTADSPLLYPVFGARKVLEPLSPAAGVWWYRHWHGEFLARALRSRLADGRPAVVYAQDPVSAGAALRARQGQRVVMVVHFNSSQADEWANKGRIPRGGRLFRSIRDFEARVLPRLDGVAYVSAFARRVLQDRLPAMRQVPSVVIHNAVPAAPPRAVTPMGDLVTIGALEPQKNHAYLLRVLATAAGLGHRWTLTVIGEGPERARLQELARRAGVADQVHFLGFQPEPRPLLAAHTLYCHTAVTESFGIAPLEAMAEGLPVLAGAVGALPELIRPGLDGAFWPLEDPHAAAQVLIAVLSDPERLAAMGTAAAARARTDYSAEALGARLLEFLDN
jgi:glycosyltransferase involved in cell wall biosynthesis